MAERSFEDRVCDAMEPGPALNIRGGTLRIHPDGELEVVARWGGTSWYDSEGGAYQQIVGNHIAGPGKADGKCPNKTALRDWLHRLDAKGEMRGGQLSDSLAEHGFVQTDDMALRVLAGLERGGWVERREVRRGVSRLVPGPNFDLKKFERWIAAGAPHDGAGQFPTDWDGKPYEQMTLFDVIEEAV